MGIHDGRVVSIPPAVVTAHDWNRGSTDVTMSQRGSDGQAVEPRRRGARMKFSSVLGPALALAVGACADSAAPDDGALFRVDVGGESFHVSVVDEAVIAEAERRIQEEDGVAIVIGTLARGDGGFNQPWSWHMLPMTVRVVDISIEVCDGRPSMVEADVDYWVDTVKQFCPWGGRLVERKR
jgi:hypothetical protein